MACFLVPAAEAVVTTTATKIMEKKEKEQDEAKLERGVSVRELGQEHFSDKLKRLNYLLWGGSGLLAFEHLWHGEIQPFFPFLTGAAEPAEMFHEMSTVGVTMAIVVTCAWGAVTFVADRIMKREDGTVGSRAAGEVKR